MSQPLPLLKFRDPEHRRMFERDGYCVLPLLEAAQVDRLLALWDARPEAARGAPYEVSLYSPDAQYRRTMCEAVAAEVEPALAAAIDDVDIICGGFACKSAQSDYSALPFHQDPNIVDEDVWGSANIWIPLVDTTPDNGPLWVAPGSHRLNRRCRAFNQPFAYEAAEAQLLRLARPVHARKGEAIVFPHSLCHFSPPNRSPRPRPSVGAMLAQSGAPLWYHFIDPADRSRIESYAVGADDFLSQPISSRPCGKSAADHVEEAPAEDWPGYESELTAFVAGQGGQIGA